MPDLNLVGSVDDRGTIWEIADTTARADIGDLQTNKADKSEIPIVQDQVTEGSDNAVKSNGIYDFVNSSVSTNTAFFVGTYNSLQELEEHADYQKPITNNDYGFVISTDAEGNTVYNRYKYNSETQSWQFEYSLNNSSFTANQWATINSGLTASDKTQIAENTNDISNLEISNANKLEQSAAASVYNPNKTYVDGDLFTFKGKLYKVDSTADYIKSDNLITPIVMSASGGFINGQAPTYTSGAYTPETFYSRWDFRTSGYIEVTSGLTYQVVCGGSYSTGRSDVCDSLYNVDKTRIGAITGVTSNPTRSYVIPANVKYIRVALSSTNTQPNPHVYIVYTSMPKAIEVTISDELDDKATKAELDTKYNKADDVTISWEDYKNLPDSKLSDNKNYYVYDANPIMPSVKVYGWHVDPNESNPDSAVTYLKDAIGMTPAAMGATTFDYGSWADAWFMPKPCMVKSDGTVDYYLDPNDYTKKADGTASDVADLTYDGNAMMEWPLIWYKYEGTSVAGEGYFYVANAKIDDSYHCWCNYDADGNIINHFYTAIYNGTGTTKLRSMSGVATTNANGCGKTSGSTEVTRATANNTTDKTEWYIDVFCDRMLINGLCILISKSLNSQAKFGNGLVTGSETGKNDYTTGDLNDKGLFWGDITNQTAGVKVFGMENWWGLVWHRTAGCVGLANGNYAIKQTWSTVDGSSTTGYNSSGDGYIAAGIRPGNSEQYVKQMTYANDCYLPLLASGATSTTYYCDYWYTANTSLTYLLVGGYAGASAYAGLSDFRLSDAFSRAYWDIGACLSLKPLAPT
jgi:hypothetical protein